MTKTIIDNAPYDYAQNCFHPKKSQSLPFSLNQGSFLYGQPGTQVHYDQIQKEHDKYYIQLKSRVLPQNTLTVRVILCEETNVYRLVVASSKVASSQPPPPCLVCSQEALVDIGCCGQEHALHVYTVCPDEYTEYLSDPRRNRNKIAFKIMLHNMTTNKEDTKKRKLRDDMDGRIRKILEPVIMWTGVLESLGIAMDHTMSFDDITSKACTLDDVLVNARRMQEYYTIECERQYQYFKTCTSFYDKYIKPDKNIVCLGLDKLIAEVSSVSERNEEPAQMT